MQYTSHIYSEADPDPNRGFFCKVFLPISDSLYRGFAQKLKGIRDTVGNIVEVLPLNGPDSGVFQIPR